MDVIQPKTSTPKGAHPDTGKRLWYSRKRAPRNVPTRVFNLPLVLFNNFPYHRLHWNLRRPTLFCLASSHHHVQGCGDISRNTNIRIENQIETRSFESIWIVRYFVFFNFVAVFWRFSRSLLDLACLQMFCLVFRFWFYYLGFCLVSHARLGPCVGLFRNPNHDLSFWLINQPTKPINCSRRPLEFAAPEILDTTTVFIYAIRLLRFMYLFSDWSTMIKW
jgi:hypothetical protein